MVLLYLKKVAINLKKVSKNTTKWVIKPFSCSFYSFLGALRVFRAF